jgi:hypothetical protein
MCRSPSETYSVSSISPGQNAVSHHQIPELSPLSRPLSESSDLPGIRCALAFAPRRKYSDGVYSASKWPPNQHMCMHHELSYTLEFPSLMLFACLIAPADGGETPVADSQALLHALPSELVERFERVGWLLIRNYNGEIGASITEAFGTDDRRAVESYCRNT